jgi:hypothetical protein
MDNLNESEWHFCSGGFDCDPPDWTARFHCQMGMGNLPLCISGFRYYISTKGLFMIFCKKPGIDEYLTFFCVDGVDYNPWLVECIAHNHVRQDMSKACIRALMFMKMLTGSNLEMYYAALEEECPDMVDDIRAQVNAGFQRMLAPLMRIRRRLFRVKCVARRWADRRWNPYTWVGQKRLLREFGELQNNTVMHISKNLNTHSSLDDKCK